jgi:hypothetical protein
VLLEECYHYFSFICLKALLKHTLKNIFPTGRKMFLTTQVLNSPYCSRHLVEILLYDFPDIKLSEYTMKLIDI